MIWAAILGASLVCFAWKYAGLAVPERVLAHPLAERVGTLIPVGLLAALIAVQVLSVSDGAGQGLALDARVAGLGVAVLLLLLRAPFLVVVCTAAAVAAFLRLLT